MSNIIKPQLLCRDTPDVDSLPFPFYVTPKLDGVRCLLKDGKVLSRTFKEIPNKIVQKQLGDPSLHGMDGELIYGPPNAPDVYRQTHSFTSSPAAVASSHAWRFYAFDIWDEPTKSYSVRMAELEYRVGVERNPNVAFLQPTYIGDIAQFNSYEEQALTDGYEGVVIRYSHGKYKYGRTTMNVLNALKVKRFKDGEARVLDVVEEMANQNEAKQDAFGRTERSTHQENMVGKSRMGAILVEDLETGIQFYVGTGFSAKDRDDWWQARFSREGLIIKYKYFPIGIKDKPRHPVYLGMREGWDL